jgi:silicon transporter
MPGESSIDGKKICNMIKYTYSVCLLIFSTTVIMGLIFTRQTRISADVHPALAFCLIWGAIIWLSMVEGGQASYVGLPPVDRELYKESHPLSYKCTGTTNKGDNLDRYLLGRQFCVLCTVFIINMSGAPIPGAELWGFPEMVTKIFLGTGLAMIFFTAMIGQLTSQVNASHCMLDYINNWLAVLVLYACMAIEWSGLIHASYLVQFFVCWLAGEPVESKEPEKSPPMKLWFWFRCAFSTFCLAGSCAVTFAALFKGQTTMWPGVPGAVSVIVFIILMSIVGLLEGMQIAFFAVAKIEEKDRGDHKCAKMTCDLLFKGKGHNLPGFMIGRQLCVVSCFFIIARVTSLAVPEGEENIFGVSDGMQAFFDTGLCGALITTILGSIAWQLVAGVFPIAFLSNPLVYIFLRICLFLEATGLCAGSWVLAFIQKKICGYQRDEVYIGTAEERAARGDPDHVENLPRGAGHMYKLPGFYEDAPDSLKELIKADPIVRKYMESIHDNTDRDVTERDPESGDEVAESMATSIQQQGISESHSA